MDEPEPQPSGGVVAKAASVREFLVTTRYEMDKVTWPQRDELRKATQAVVIGSLALGVLIGLLDWVLQKILVNGVALLAR
jgi:preprotein translocase SecE subunit